MERDCCEVICGARTTCGTRIDQKADRSISFLKKQTSFAMENLIMALDRPGDEEKHQKVVICGKYKNLNKITKI